jgi:hypothetical protein
MKTMFSPRCPSSHLLIVSSFDLILEEAFFFPYYKISLSILKMNAKTHPMCPVFQSPGFS